MDQVLAVVELVYLIIGGGSFLGAKIIEWLQTHGFTGRIIVLDPTPKTFNTININGNRVRYIRGSFRDGTVLDEIFREQIQAVFHLASIGHYGLVGGNREEVFRFNVQGTVELIDRCRRHGVARFIYASSVAVSFIGVPLINASEDDPMPAPDQYLDFYSRSKAEADQYVLAQSSKRFKTACLRFRGIYGAEDPVVTHKVATMIKRGLFVAKISAHPGRESQSNGSSGVNCAKAFALADAMLRTNGGLHGRAYYIVDGEEMGQYEFWNPIVPVLGGSFPTVNIPYEPLRLLLPLFEKACYSMGIPPMLTVFELAILANDNTFSIERARRELGYVPEPSSMPEVSKVKNKSIYHKFQVVNFYSLEGNLPQVTRNNWQFIISSSLAILIIFGSIVLYQFFV
ncbi:hypothetical protein CAEBREN_17567 [Caenorhabditis brenneri]|uniref:3-beta hydroxysteroid dehydrogenase/isomerase domain-containing protein n=1 Tax=Caenorhabditis brenneri TaxID=135651 RepID=G0NJ81_CAEBE|nr:hypothetical protein CAEBREN_17567 [Caenorhabditis brenneri]